jgi:hypothetical protein
VLIPGVLVLFGMTLIQKEEKKSDFDVNIL